MNIQRDRGMMSDGAIAGTVAIVGLIVVGIIVGFVWLVGGTWSKTDASSMTCIYNGGPFDDRSYKGFEEPGTGRTYQGFASEAINVPVSLRQYRVSLDPTQGDTETADAVRVRVKGYELTFEPTVTFTINTALEGDKPVACSFIERQLRQFNATDFDDPHGDWVGYLNERFRPVLTDVMSRVLQTYDPGDLKFNNDKERDAAAEQVGIDLKAALVRQFGDDYFCASTYKFGQDAEACGNSLTVILPEPKLSAEDEELLSRPQRAKIDANNEIAAAQEQARKAAEVATARALEAESAAKRADAEEQIASEQARVETAQAELDYAWCAYVASLGQDCALVKAAQNGDYPDVVVGGSDDVAVPVG